MDSDTPKPFAPCAPATPSRAAIRRNRFIELDLAWSAALPPDEPTGQTPQLDRNQKIAPVLCAMRNGMPILVSRLRDGRAGLTFDLVEQEPAGHLENGKTAAHFAVVKWDSVAPAAVRPPRHARPLPGMRLAGAANARRLHRQIAQLTRSPGYNDSREA